MMRPQSLRWRMPLLIRFTLALHVALLAGCILYPQAWRWALVLLLANHAVLTLAGLWPRSTWLGPNWTRLPHAAALRGEIALTIDDGPDPDVTPQLLDLLDRHGVKATFFCIGERAARHPALCRRIVERGHAVENHSQRHRHYFSLLGMAGLAREIQMAQDTLTALTGRRPQFFRAPAGLRNPFLDPVLARFGLRLAAWTRRGFDTRTPDPALVSRRLLRDLAPGAIFLLHDGNCARAPSGVPVVIEALPALFDAAAGAGLRFVTLSDAMQSP
ncbi:MAG TPA: polysaccharide deacetylase family protein [Paucimonas sp.]|nr:polysaccharide deacetylase family protein [Paucimonas sp.]